MKFKSNSSPSALRIFLALWLSATFALPVACSHQKNPPNTNAAGTEASADEALIEGIPSEEVGSEPVEELPTEVPETEAQVTGKYRWRVPKSDLPIALNKHVYSWMNYFTGRGRPYYEKWLERKPFIEAMMVRVLEEYNLPKDLVYLSMIESGFNPRAYSRAKASGPWQFIKGTGKLYGLQVNHWVDERRDPEKATDAAARHLRDLYQQFGDWYLVAAAYNAGPRKVEGAIRRKGSRDFWQLIEGRHRYLRAETRNYVPKLLAALIIGKQPEAFGFEKPPAVAPETVYDLVAVHDASDLRVIAQCASTDVETIKLLNPEILYWFTPPSDGDTDYLLRIPAGTKDLFQKEFAAIPPESRVTFREHVLKRGETLSSVARQYRTTQSAIMQLNRISNAKRMKNGQVLFIPIRAGETYTEETVARAEVESREEGHRRHRGHSRRSSHTSVASAEPKLRERSIAGKQPPNTKAIRHVIKDGDTLWALSMKYNVSIRSIKKWNAIRRASQLRPGDVVTIYVPSVS